MSKDNEDIGKTGEVIPPGQKPDKNSEGKFSEANLLKETLLPISWQT